MVISLVFCACKSSDGLADGVQSETGETQSVADAKTDSSEKTVSVVVDPVPFDVNNYSTWFLQSAPTASVTAGTAVQQRAYTSDTVYNDEWYLVAMLPTSGYELDYDINNPRWTDGMEVEINTCFSYAINSYNWRTLPHEIYIEDTPTQSTPIIPGEYSGYGYPEIDNLSKFVNAIKADFAAYSDYENKEYVFKEIGAYEVCPSGCYKVALYFSDSTYHWFRQDSDGFWSQKPMDTVPKQGCTTEPKTVDPAFSYEFPYDNFIA